MQTGSTPADTIFHQHEFERALREQEIAEITHQVEQATTLLHQRVDSMVDAGSPIARELAVKLSRSAIDTLAPLSQPIVSTFISNSSGIPMESASPLVGSAVNGSAITGVAFAESSINNSFDDLTASSRSSLHDSVDVFGKVSLAIMTDTAADSL